VSLRLKKECVVAIAYVFEFSRNHHLSELPMMRTTTTTTLRFPPDCRAAVLGLRRRLFHLKRKLIVLIYFVGWIANRGSPHKSSAARLRACLLLYFLLILLYYYYSIIINVLQLSIVDTRRHPTPLYYEEKKASWHDLTILITMRIRGLCQDLWRSSEITSLMQTLIY